MNPKARILQAFVLLCAGACTSTGSTPSGVEVGDAGNDLGAAGDGSSTSSSGSASSSSGAANPSGSMSEAGAGSSGGGSGSASGSSSDAGSGSPAGSDSGSAPASCPDAGGGAQTCGSNPVAQAFNAGLTYYQQTSANNCAMPWPSNGMYTALSTNLYDNPSGSASCGKCVQVNGKTLLVVDQCPQKTNQAQCSTNHLDLSTTAYQAVQGSLNPGMVSNSPGLSVKFVPCPVSGNIQYSFTSSSQQYYLALIILNAKYGIAKVEYRAPSSCGWTELGARSDGDPHFTLNGVMVPKPIDLRVTDEWGHVLEDDGVAWAAGQTVTGGAQFPTCP
jgi:expansin (peptidoglycan-binding protein)